MKKRTTIIRDISWLSFNRRVLQEASDINVPLKERIKFLGIFSNNMDEFFRVRVATLKRMIELGNKAKMHLEIDPVNILYNIQEKVLEMQKDFDKTWRDIQKELKKKQIRLIDNKRLNVDQQRFVLKYFNEQVRSQIVPLMIESIETFPALSDRYIYLACELSKKDRSVTRKYALIPVPTRILPRFQILPSKTKEQPIILLEDIIRYCLPNIFSFFGFDQFDAYAIKVTRDAEIDIDNDLSTTLIQKIEKGLKNRKKAKPTRLVYDKSIPPAFLRYLIKRLGLAPTDNFIPGGRIHNFKDFMNFPESVFQIKKNQQLPFIHPALRNINSITKVVLTKDIMLHFPYHSFNNLIDYLREAAMDPQVTEIKITCYRLARQSKVINALINAARNGKKVTVVIELRARFDEEANLNWKNELDEAGVKVLIGLPHMKVHAKICQIKKRAGNKTIQYGFVSTGNLNEKTAEVYGDHCLLTANQQIMADINRIFTYLEKPESRHAHLKACKTLLVSPFTMRKKLISLIDKEIRHAQNGKKAGIILKLNSLSDQTLINKLYEAARAGVTIKLIIRSICCMLTENNKFKTTPQAISIVDEYLEHARVMIFHNNGHEKVFISSADWMIRNIDHRIETAAPVLDKNIKQELIDILNIQLQDNTKARILDNEQLNQYVHSSRMAKKRSQHEIYQFLFQKRGKSPIPDFYI